MGRISTFLRGGTLAFLTLCSAGAAFAAAPLFPRPLHLTRTVEDSVSGRTAVIEEYCYGNRVASVSNGHTVIVDYEKQEIVEISFTDATYSVMRFEDVARFANAGGGRESRAAAAFAEKDWNVRAKGARANAEFFEAEPKGASAVRRIEVGIDRSVALSKDALEVLTGSAYPNKRTIESELTVRTAAPAAGERRSLQANSAAPAETVYGLPVEQTVTYSGGAEDLVMRMRVTKVEEAEPPRDKVTPPPGAKLIPSRIAETLRTMGEIDRTTPQN